MGRFAAPWYHPFSGWQSMASRRSIFVCLLAIGCCPLLAISQQKSSPALRIASPDGQIVLLLSDSSVGPASDPSCKGMHYAVDFHGKWLMDESALGLKLEGQNLLGPGMRQVGIHSGDTNESYTIPVGKTKTVRDLNHHATVDFKDTAGRELSIEVRAFNDGVAFRYIVPAQSALAKMRIEHELTEFRYSKDATVYPLILDGINRRMKTSTKSGR